MSFLTLLILNILSIVGASIGLLLFLRPSMAIDIQRKFYAFINWRMEPISMQKELRSTRIMGIIFIIVALAAVVYIFI